MRGRFGRGAQKEFAMIGPDMTAAEGRERVDTLIALAQIAEHRGAGRRDGDARRGSDERRWWVEQLDAAFRDEPASATADVNVHWRARIGELIAAWLGPRLEAQRDAVMEAYEAVMTVAGISKYQRERIHEGVDQQAARR